MNAAASEEYSTFIFMEEVCPKFAHRKFPRNISTEVHSAVVHKDKALVCTAMNDPNYLKYQHEFKFLTYKNKKP